MGGEAERCRCGAAGGGGANQSPRKPLAADGSRRGQSAAAAAPPPGAAAQASKAGGGCRTTPAGAVPGDSGCRERKGGAPGKGSQDCGCHGNSKTCGDAGGRSGPPPAIVQRPATAAADTLPPAAGARAKLPPTLRATTTGDEHCRSIAGGADIEAADSANGGGPGDGPRAAPSGGDPRPGSGGVARGAPRSPHQAGPKPPARLPGSAAATLDLGTEALVVRRLAWPSSMPVLKPALIASGLHARAAPAGAANAAAAPAARPPRTTAAAATVLSAAAVDAAAAR